MKSEGKKSDMKEYIHYDSISIKFKSSQNHPIVFKVMMGIAFGGIAPAVGGAGRIRRFLDAGNVLFLDLGVGYMGIQLVKIQGAVHL